MKRLLIQPIVIVLLLTNLPVMAEPTLAELEARCETARERLIAPLRKKEIERCTAQKYNSRDMCERKFRDYGNAPQGGTRLFSDIPECVAAQEARLRGKGAKESAKGTPRTTPSKTESPKFEKKTYSDGVVDRTSKQGVRDRTSHENVRDRTSDRGRTDRSSDPEKSRDRTSTDGISDR